MGSCVSVHKGTAESTALKLGASFGFKNNNLVTPESPIKDKHVDAHPPLPVMTCDDYGSKDETFFDSRAWLDSDCEDDFFSVCGDFTPSWGNTPVHRNFPTGTPKINKSTLERASAPGFISEPSPTGKKRLSELFCEGSRDGQDADNLDSSSGMQDIPNGKTEPKQTILDVLPKSASGTPYISGANSVCSSERTADGDALTDKEKQIKSAQCCLPSLISCHSFSGRKKKMSPAIAVNDQA